jgi:hypothetical protein
MLQEASPESREVYFDSEEAFSVVEQASRGHEEPSSMPEKATSAFQEAFSGLQEACPHLGEASSEYQEASSAFQETSFDSEKGYFAPQEASSSIQGRFYSPQEAHSFSIESVRRIPGEVVDREHRTFGTRIATVVSERADDWPPRSLSVAPVCWLRSHSISTTLERFHSPIFFNQKTQERKPRWLDFRKVKLRSPP